MPQAKKPKGVVQSLVEQIGELMRQPLSDESYEVQPAKTVRRSKSVAAGKRRAKTTKARKTTKKRSRR